MENRGQETEDRRTSEMRTEDRTTRGQKDMRIED